MRNKFSYLFSIFWELECIKKTFHSVSFLFGLFPSSRRTRFSTPNMKGKRSHVWQHNKNDFISNPFASFCCCCCSLVAKQMEGTAQWRTAFSFLFFNKVSTINRCRLYTHTSNTLSLPPPNGTVECQLYPPPGRLPSFSFPRVVFHILASSFFVFFLRQRKTYQKEITKQLDAYNLI